MPNTSPRILIVDDHQDTRYALQTLLLLEGYQVTGVTSGVEALQYLYTHSLPDLILLDLYLPNVDGWELRAQLLRHPQFAQIPVVVISGTELDPHKLKQHLHVAAFFRKPFDVQKLLATIQKFCPQPTDN